MFENEFYIAQLVSARIRGSITDAQQSELDAWVGASEQNAIQYQKYIDEGELDTRLKRYYTVDSAAVFKKINDRLRSNEGGLPVVVSDRSEELRGGGSNAFMPKVLTMWPKIAIAAAIVFAVFAGIWFYTSYITGAASEVQYAEDVAPGKEGATLTLANGKKIRLSDAVNGELAREAGVKIIKTDDGQLVYSIEGDADNNSINTLSTSNGETYQVKLPDGSNVWLNSASSISYRASLNDKEFRRIKLSGEAYFEIAKDINHPFVVESAGQTVEVLGTHFNINSYKEELATATTLSEGSVKITSVGSTNQPSLNSSELQRTLAPGEQALNNSRGLIVRKVNTESVTDWKDGEFNLQGVEFDALMRKIARWYDVEVVYDQSLEKDVKIGGWISREKKLSQVLRFIESSGAVHFKIENRKVIVMK